MKLLVVEDEALLRHHLFTRLSENGHVVDAVRTAEEALYRAESFNHDLALVDLGLPGMSGIDLIRQLRSQDKNFPILILTARGNWQDKVEGLSCGADDYVVKPYSVVELMARLRTQLRRTRPASMGERLSFGDIILDAGEHRVFRGGQALHLGPTEFRLLSTLMEKPGRVWTREQLLDRVWGRDIYVDTRTIDVHVGRLRKALMAHGGDNPVRTVRGTGYALG